MEFEADTITPADIIPRGDVRIANQSGLISRRADITP